MNFINPSIFAVYKPKGPTSHDVVDEIRKLTGVRKVGHAGTLDPLASGVLVIAIGRDATKQLDTLKSKEKEYRAVIELGATSATDDSEGHITSQHFKQQPSIGDVEKVLPAFLGKIEQIPPLYSAVHVAGKRAYKLARQQKDITLAPRAVEIKSIKLSKYEWPYLEIGVVTGPGVYIRALARDIGEKLGVGGYLKELERTRVGDYTLEKTVKIEEI
ncbi:MAG TPA: tRNA pseudouridine(55) synthase TruB [Patescibacteria group bacterium]|nr:tRNA pseudouridine(55) synthase TruB [Patescibacteria group bacterium]